MKAIEVTAILMVPALVLGIFGNMNLLFATFRLKQLQNRNGILIALIAFFDFISELHESKNAIEILSGKSLMPRSVCIRSILLYLISFNMASVAILFLAIDRFIAVWSPLSADSSSAQFPILAHSATHYFHYPSLPVIKQARSKFVEPCILSKSYSPRHVKTIRNYMYVSITFFVVVLNVASYLLVQRGKKKHKMAMCGKSQRMHITNSMLVLMTTYASTMFASSSITFVIKFSSFPKKIIASITSFLSILVVINYGYTYYVLLWRSHDYRKAFLSQLGFYGSNRINVVIVKEIQTVKCVINKKDKDLKS